jgi:hypothetical protein
MGGGWDWPKSEEFDGELAGKTEWEICRLVGGLWCLGGEEASVAGAGWGLSGRRTRWGGEVTTLLDCQQQGLPEHQRTLVWSTR